MTDSLGEKLEIGYKGGGDPPPYGKRQGFLEAPRPASAKALKRKLEVGYDGGGTVPNTGG